ncbi:hypothetical protein AMAG_02676 [Allomyces macrogynus ATCC 38327]|uniref:Uncharacterized protein n=1 Tax=Allomyces macrogynus (strain ATCC 38327) TaxID=578462 RepID=A0A0L0S3B4_ALLM3|nr:hypothetical protein AMAG_02676 [Allomyces macrogynus ATCC 38327]|eukprot:KNE56906.1 hypothetical protein AMAG_02676 [Allomyces macrogynus ATCC 38327]
MDSTAPEPPRPPPASSSVLMASASPSLVKEDASLVAHDRLTKGPATAIGSGSTTAVLLPMTGDADASGNKPSTTTSTKLRGGGGGGSGGVDLCIDTCAVGNTTRAAGIILVAPSDLDSPLDTAVPLLSAASTDATPDPTVGSKKLIVSVSDATAPGLLGQDDPMTRATSVQSSSGDPDMTPSTARPPPTPLGMDGVGGAGGIEDMMRATVVPGHANGTRSLPAGGDEMLMDGGRGRHAHGHHHGRPVHVDLPNLLEEEEEKESFLAKLQRRVEERRSKLEQVQVYPPLLGETSWWHLSTSVVFMGLAILNMAINIKIIFEVATPAAEVVAAYNVFHLILLYGLAKDAFRFVAFLLLLATGAWNHPALKWLYAFIAHSPFLLPLFLSQRHRPKLIPALSYLNHPKIVFWDIFFGDVPSAILSFLAKYNNKWEVFTYLTVASIFVTTLFRLTRFLWIALLMMNEYGQKRARASRLLKHLYLWGRGLEYYIVFLGEDADKQKLIQHVKSRVQDFQEMKAQHIQDAWAKGFKSIIILNTLQSIMSLLSGIYRFQLDKTPDVSDYVDDFEYTIKEYESELMSMRGKALWKLTVKDRHIELITKLWANPLVRMALVKFQTTNADKWNERRFTRIMGVKDILDDPHQITSLLSTSLTVDEYCLDNAQRILADDYEPTPQDLAHMPISLTELLFTELCKSTSYHIKDRILANNICILDVPKRFSRSRLQALIPFCQTVIVFLDMNKFDELVTVTRARPKPPTTTTTTTTPSGAGGASSSTPNVLGSQPLLGPPGLGANIMAGASGMHLGASILLPSEQSLTAAPKGSSMHLAAPSSTGKLDQIEVSTMDLNGAPLAAGTAAGPSTATPNAPAAAGAGSGGGGSEDNAIKPRLLVDIEFFERMCTMRDKNNMVTGVLVFWKNYNAFKARVNAPGTLANFTTLYPDYSEKSHGTLNGPNVIRYFKRRILRAANPTDRYVSIIPDWELNKRFDLFATLNEVIFDHYVVHRVT